MNLWLLTGIFYAAGAAGFSCWWIWMVRTHPAITDDFERDPWPVWVCHSLMILAWPVITMFELAGVLPHQQNRP